ncbi:MAG: DUF4258 domain-containing protein [Nitrospinota bacterium]|nr:DUF4258 domain-containing protein [Nitrospinota bacterium]MDP7369937.1 DUF4258 domain-containing protein [Nitrospinota bacterium]MDP7664613.1 DUF4258 domain-containing protein [Nitrospinota bacterium]
MADRLFKDGAYRPTDHMYEMGNERDIDLLDVGHCLENGEIFDEPAFDKPHKEWRYTIRGPDIDGEEISVIVSFEEFEGETVVIITVKRKGKRTYAVWVHHWREARGWQLNAGNAERKPN